MLLQSARRVVDCPVCGRPLEVQSELVDQQVRCSHCLGEFYVQETHNGALATTFGEADTSGRENDLRHCDWGSDASSSTYPVGRRTRKDASVVIKERRKRSSIPLLEHSRSEQEPQSIVLLVEHRDEVFARLATDMAEFGVRVIRAKTASEALTMYDKYDPSLLVSLVDLTDQSGWLLTAKLRLRDRRIRVWLYQCRPSDYGQEIAEFLSLDAILTDQDDLLRLSETIVALMKSRHGIENGPNSCGQTGDSKAA